MQNIMGKLILSVFFLIICFIYVGLYFTSGDIYINEVMPNPSDNCSDCTEWLELFSTSHENLTNWKLNTGETTNLTINATINDYLVITDDKETFLSFWDIPQEKIIELNIGLTNSGDNIKPYNSIGELKDSFSYNSSTENKPWARLLNGTFVICDPTPGFTNNCSQTNSTNQTNQTNSTTPTIEIISYLSEIYNNGTEFNVNISIKNFLEGYYDLKLEMLDSSGDGIGEIYDPILKYWHSQDRYNKEIYIKNINFSYLFLSRMKESYFGLGNIKVKIRKTNTTNILSESIAKQINILNGTISQNSSNTTNPSSESYIEILDYPDKAIFGEKIDVDFHVYKGDTGKYAVYVYVQNEDEEKVSEKITVHAGNSSSSSKFKDYYFEEEVLLDCLDESGKYELVVEGLDSVEIREIELDKCSGAEKSSSSSKTEYIIENPEKIKIGEKIIIPVKIINNENFEKSFLVWSYIYNGPKCYSCIDNREENSKQISVGAFSEETIYLENTVISAITGEYNLKIKILKDGLKTPKELTYPIYLENSEEMLNQIEYEERIMGNVAQPNNFYATTEMKSKKSIFLESTPYLLSTLAMLFCVYLVVKKI